MKEYIKSSVNRDRKEYYLFNQTPIFILNELPPNININQIIQILESYIPKFMFDSIEGIYIGEFKELKDRNIQALFKDSAIYLSSFKDSEGVSEEIIAKDIVHELAHAMEDKLSYEIYYDDRIENEYNGKKKKLLSILRYGGYKIPEELFFSNEMVDELDDLLYKKIGYDKLSLLTPGLFLSPYSITSIREYFANGVEEYLLGEPNVLKDISPILYSKLEMLDKQFFSGEMT
jgi:hypothetical protein